MALKNVSSSVPNSTRVEKTAVNTTFNDHQYFCEPLDENLFIYPSQCSITVNCIYWTKQMEIAIGQSEYNKDAMSNLCEAFQNAITE